jgi:hypothetical protein
MPDEIPYGTDVLLVGRGGRVHGGHVLIRTVDCDLYPAILGVGGAALAIVGWFLSAEADHVNAIDRNIVLRNQVLHYAIRASTAKCCIVIGGAGFIGESFDSNEIALES